MDRSLASPLYDNARVAPADAVLITAIESSLFAYSPLAGVSTPLGIKGMQGRVTSLSHPLANLVGMAQLAENDAAATIDAVKARFAKERKAFGWVTGPLTKPADLGRRLGKAGLQPIAHLAGMAAPLDLKVNASSDVQIREVTPEEQSRETDMMGTAYGMPPDVAALFVRLVSESPGIKSRGYFAYAGGSSPVAWSYLVYLPDSPVVLLGGAATLPEARGKGIYSALVKRRLADALADGREAAVIQADRDTSAPICAKLGFRELCALEVYAWSPETRRTG
jgi:GNAT superfamily N-acetyltransferase